MSESALYSAIAGALVLLVLNLLAIISVFRSERSVEAKAVWAISITLVPIVGLIYWLGVVIKRYR